MRWPRTLSGMDTHPETTRTLGQGLAGYVRAVAAEVGVPTEGTGYEVSDTATAYLGLSDRWAGRDLMLVWSERHGWSIAVETEPAEPPVVVAHLGGGDPVPEPAVVGQFVAEVEAGGPTGRRPRPDFAAAGNRDLLARRLSRYAVDLA
jgi:uncharacterized protein DUF6292